MAECIFNKPEKTLDYIVIIVNERQQQIGSNNAYSLACLGVAYIYINVKIKGKDYKFVFDTGTENTYISKHAAEKLGLKTLDAYNGFHMAHIDSIAIGDIIYKDPIAFVFDPLTQEKHLNK